MYSSTDLFKQLSWITNPDATLDVAIVGAGGTGSFLASHIARLQSVLDITGRKRWNVTVFDPKVVTMTTVSKQMFLWPEVGMNKAAALVTRLNRAYNLDWKIGNIFNPSTDNGKYNIVLGCTDSIEFRNQMMKKGYKNTLWLDAGCYEDYGQVLAIIKGYTPNYKDLNIDNFKEYPDSCDSLQSLRIQHPAINPLLACVMYGWLYDTLIKYNPPFYQSYVNLSMAKQTSSLLTLEDIQ